jgi:hypothetical protein
MRAAEGELFVSHMGGTYTCAGLSEATLRYDDSDWSLAFFEENEVAIANSNNRRPEGAVLDQWVAWLMAFISNRPFDEIWIPLGAGTHSDHDLARNAALIALMRLKPKATVRIYQDVPYGSEYKEHVERILGKLLENGARLTPWFQDVGDAFDTKLSLLSIFASQFKVSAVQGGVERSAGGDRTEHLWAVDLLPLEVPSRDIWIGAPEAAAAAARIPNFLSGASHAGRLAIFAFNASGRWANDLKLFETKFPKARFVIYAGPKVIAEFEAVSHPRTEVRRLDGRRSSWVKAALRESATGHRVIIAGDAIEKARSMSRIWPFGRNMIVAAMDHLSQALSQQ